MQPISMQMAYELPVPLSCGFIDRHMASCNPVYALIYIYALRHCCARGESLSVSAIGEIFNILESDVLKAWKHWESQGLVRFEETDGNISIIFLPVPEHAEKIEKIEIPAAKPRLFTERPQYTVEELEMFKQQGGEITRLFKHAEESLAKLLTFHDMNVLFGFYEWLRLPVDVILFMLTYCAERNQRDLRYIEKVAMDWAERGFETVEAAQDYTGTFDRDYRAIMRLLGHPNAFPSPTQRKYMDKWLQAVSLELVLEACDKAAVENGKPHLKYIDKIIENWSKKKISTLEGVRAQDAHFSNFEKKEIKGKRNRFANFKGRERDFEQIERLEREHLMKSLKV